MSSAPKLQACDLGIGHGKRTIASGLNFAVEPGEILALLGPNGSGKSTLLRTLLGLHAPLAGRVLLGNTPIAAMPRPTLAQHLGYVPQNHNSHFGYTVHETVLMGRAAHLPMLAQPGPHDHALATACQQRLGIAHLAGSSMHAISGGERQLALIARALAQQAAILIMDEPTASLDFGNQLRVLEHLQHLRAQGISIVLCTHQPQHALAVADRIMLLHQGKLMGPDAPHTIASAENLAELYRLTPAQVRTHLQC